ncbi:32200_t:CDS:1, partial [Racocetra persica]
MLRHKKAPKYERSTEAEKQEAPRPRSKKTPKHRFKKVLKYARMHQSTQECTEAEKQESTEA